MGRSRKAKQFQYQYKRMKSFGHTLLSWAELLLKQNFCCATCKQPPSVCGPLALDHRHSDGQPRGLLCKTCNCGVGHIHENKEVAKNMIDYLEEYDAKPLPHLLER